MGPVHQEESIVGANVARAFLILNSIQHQTDSASWKVPSFSINKRGNVLCLQLLLLPSFQ
jgi:hypothetical protein